MRGDLDHEGVVPSDHVGDGRAGWVEDSGPIGRPGQPQGAAASVGALDGTHGVPPLHTHATHPSDLESLAVDDGEGRLRQRSKPQREPATAVGVAQFRVAVGTRGPTGVVVDFEACLVTFDVDQRRVGEQIGLGAHGAPPPPREKPPDLFLALGAPTGGLRGPSVRPPALSRHHGFHP